jgi:TRAP-type mannitol/chloroaromatic compound transport system permease large subunit
MDPVLLGEILAASMFLGVIGFLLLGFPVAFTLAGVSIMFAVAGNALGVFDMSNLRALAGRYTGYMINEEIGRAHV